MNFMIKKGLVLLGSAVLFSGCFNSEVAKCSDESVKELVSQIYNEQIKNNTDNPMLSIYTKMLPELTSLESIRAVSYKKDVNMRECKGVMHFKDGTTTDLQYSVQADEEDSSLIYVELDTTFLQTLLMKSMMQGIDSK